MSKTFHTFHAFIAVFCQFRENLAILQKKLQFLFCIKAEQREKMEKENQQTLADEIDRIKLETEQEKAELKVK